MDQLKKLPGALLPWYEEHKRDLPWRQDKEPYHIWVSEIMLQQTRVEAVKGYYTRFLAALPTIADLANADEALLLKLWEGLGYYSRVRNLKKAAQVIVSDYSGQFPTKYDRVLALPGIGEYTAGAVCSIAFNQRTPAVDGNVLRVFARLTADDTPIDTPAFKKKAQMVLGEIYPEKAGDFTQALMELGATICGPNKKPNCKICPCRDICLAYKNGTAENLPVRLPKKSRRQEEYTVLILRCADQYALEKRPSRGLLASLWQFPNIAGHLTLEEVIQTLESKGIVVSDVLRQTEKSHIFTHIQWNMKGVYLEVEEPSGTFQWFTKEQINLHAALPTAFKQFWDLEDIEYV